MVLLCSDQWLCEKGEGRPLPSHRHPLAQGSYTRGRGRTDMPGGWQPCSLQEFIFLQEPTAEQCSAARAVS